MGQSVSRDDFIWTLTDQPHMSRREAISKKYPQIKKLFGVDPSLKYVVTSMVLFQVFMCWLLQDADWTLILLQTYFCGGIINHALTLAIHDISHNTAFGNEHPLKNRFFGILANLPISVPVSVSFKKYHVEHHRYLGEDGLDTDVPTELEAKLFTSTFRKFLWLAFQPFFYAFRPLIIYKKAPTDMEILNAIVQFSFDFAIYYFFGIKSLLYLFIGTLLSMGLHPSAGHFIAEHYAFKEDQETFSYYGLWNYCTFNVGYHVEHHDFPYIPGRDLPKVRQIAPEFYENLYQHQSMTKILTDFVFDPSMGPYARLKRKPRASQQFYGNYQLWQYADAFLHYIGFYRSADLNNNSKKGPTTTTTTTHKMKSMCSIVAALVLIIAVCDAFSPDRLIPLVDFPSRSEYDYARSRFLPVKERRGALDGFEDMSGFLRQIDGIQKPRFG
ncbi:unnamed protein product [Caenorhabditis bovis]|uniref:sphingolipid 4-desaturase n=1 Tax=Caenorhabditis bovis TaxID=2654633 RepID=A0A8S1EXB0_9PELO|nr:unnamed protein product [Caenorhabditis bovis]